MRRILCFIFLLTLPFTTLANEVKVELNPQKPVMGEVFQAYFRVFTESNEEPSVNFSPSNVEVVGKSNQGISTRTIYANGKLTVTREMTIVYDLVASRQGSAYLRDISVQLGDKVLRHPTVSFTVLKEPEELADVFVMADVPKKEIFLGEGIVARYYLYSRVPVSNLDVKKYPKLNNFLKRFLQEPDRSERVSVNGQVYLRNLIYAAKLFPEKVGTLKVDSLHLSATYPSSGSVNAFGAFGMSRDFRTRTLNSETVNIKVNPLPEPVPPHFSGLVGKHDFRLSFAQNKLIVNEPLEVKLTVAGVGALENLDPPVVLKHPDLEEFESNGELKIANADQATKIFDYTFLPKANLKIPANKIVLSYLDPESGKYVPTELDVPEIIVAGGSAANRREEPKADKAPSVQQPKESEPAPQSLSAPSFSVDSNAFSALVPYLNLTLAGLSVLIALGWIIKTKSFNLVSFNGQVSVPHAFKKGNFNFSELSRWMAPVVQQTGKSPLIIIRDSDLKEETKRYFLELINASDNKDYSLHKTSMRFTYQASHFKELGRYIESVKNDSSSTSSGYSKA